MSKELKPCPFCGGEPTFESYDRLYSISCHKCGYSRGFSGLITTVPHGKPISKETSCVVEYYNPNARDEAIAAWNTRAERTCKVRQAYFDSDDELFEIMEGISFRLKIPSLAYAKGAVMTGGTTAESGRDTAQTAAERWWKND